ncbi:DUF58 domain-containing protein [Actinoallomurus rhizosphaericola]|uniref:DUF58 domain-containing protein n=1 Tax=Actinoallomurus rhizosphaericola TaxID=2952536 RepID=UPI0020936EAB|nr:DUF58 domain-containing protein [Actinoallomurus rhizosphaericola]MCO5997011.1 DUF58 domain-containing protein [Actinoallomurus rhizosphaericola]
MSRSPKLGRLAPERSLKRLELQVTRRLDGLLHGEHLGLLPGPGSDLAEARLYQPGEDDVRHMDWAVTARTTVSHVRDLIADHELETWALVDMSPSMDFGTARMTKRDLAVAALAAVGFLTARLGDRLGAYIMHGGQVRRWPARTGRSAMYALLQGLLDTPREAAAGSASGPGPGLADGISGLARGQVRRGLRVVISDFLDGQATTGGELPWQRPLRRLAVRNQVIAVEIVDPRELDLPDVGPVLMSDPETGETREIILSGRVRAAYAAAASAQRARIGAAIRGSGASHLVLRTDRDWISDVARFALQQRRVAGRPQPRGGRP